MDMNLIFLPNTLKQLFNKYFTNFCMIPANQIKHNFKAIEDRHLAKRMKTSFNFLSDIFIMPLNEKYAL